MRINKLLSNRGICSRRQANDLLEAGRILVNGEVGFPGQWVEETDIILLDGEVVEEKAGIYLMLNKPVGIECTAATHIGENIISYMNYPEYIFPVGRLDKDSKGLMLLTNDGPLASRIVEAEQGHEKEYIVTVDRPYPDVLLTQLAGGVQLKDVTTRKCQVTRVSEDTFRIVLTQGMNRQIRKMTKAFDYEVISLERIRLVTLKLGELPYGKWREVTKEEVTALCQALGEVENKFVD